MKKWSFVEMIRLASAPHRMERVRPRSYRGAYPTRVAVSLEKVNLHPYPEERNIFKYFGPLTLAVIQKIQFLLGKPGKLKRYCLVEFDLKNLVQSEWVILQEGGASKWDGFRSPLYRAYYPIASMCINEDINIARFWKVLDFPMRDGRKVKGYWFLSEGPTAGTIQNFQANRQELEAA